MHVKYIVYFLAKDRDATPDSPTKRFSIMGYNRVIKKLLGSSNITKTNISDFGLTKYMTEKILGYLDKPIPENVENEVLKLSLTNITGIGPKKADELIAAGLKSTAQLKQKKYKSMLNTDSKIATKHQPIKKIPHNEIKKIESKLIGFNGVALVGSFRRRKPFSKDIDIMIASDKKNILHEYLDYLDKHFKIDVYAKGVDKMAILLKAGNKWFKADIFKTPKTERHAMILYSTGSKMFNIRMRARAKRMGYLLNQKGLYKDGKKIPIRSEKGFFTKLGMDYVEPRERT